MSELSNKKPITSLLDLSDTELAQAKNDIASAIHGLEGLDSETLTPQERSQRDKALQDARNVQAALTYEHLCRLAEKLKQIVQARKQEKQAQAQDQEEGQEHE